MKSQEIYNYIVNYLKSGACTVEKDEVTMPCPGCGDNKHFSINIRKGVFNCFKCEVGGNIRYEIQRNRREWSSLISGLLPGHPTGYIRKASPFCPLRGTAISAFLRGVPPKQKELRWTTAVNAMRYCLKRGMTKRQIEIYRVCVKALDPRVWFPYWNEKGELTYEMGRSMVNSVEPKTFSIGEELPLFGRHVYIERDEVVLVEGVFDHFATPHSYALMGSNVTGPQIIQLREDGIKRIFVILDPDAHRQSVTAARRLANFGFDVFPVVIGDYSRDPADIGRKKMSEIVRTLKLKHPVRPQTIYFGM